MVSKRNDLAKLIVPESPQDLILVIIQNGTAKYRLLLGTVFCDWYMDEHFCGSRQTLERSVMVDSLSETLEAAEAAAAAGGNQAETLPPAALPSASGLSEAMVQYAVAFLSHPKVSLNIIWPESCYWAGLWEPSFKFPVIARLL